MNLNPSDRAALEIGRLFMRAHAAEQMIEMLQAKLSEKSEDSPTPPARKRKT